MSSPLHLAKRALSSLSNSEPQKVDAARSILNPREFTLWNSMQGRDKSHSLQVLSRFEVSCPDASREEKAAALLHDVGKIRSDLGWLLRIVATLVGARSRRMTDYLAHEQIGAEMLTPISDARTVELVGGVANDPVARILRDADDI